MIFNFCHLWIFLEGWLLPGYPLKLTPSLLDTAGALSNPLVCIGCTYPLSKTASAGAASDPALFITHYHTHKSITCRWEYLGADGKAEAVVRGLEPDQLRHHLYLGEHGGLLKIKDKWNEWVRLKSHLAQHHRAHLQSSRNLIEKGKQAHSCVSPGMSVLLQWVIALLEFCSMNLLYPLQETWFLALTEPPA